MFQKRKQILSQESKFIIVILFFRGSSRVPAPLTGTRDEPLRTSAWEAIVATQAISYAKKEFYRMI